LELHTEYIEFLRNEVKAFDIELREMVELPSVDSVRARIKKYKRDTQAMLDLYTAIKTVNNRIRLVKQDIRYCNEVAMKLLGHNLQRPRRKYTSRDTSYDF